MKLEPYDECELHNLIAAFKDTLSILKQPDAIARKKRDIAELEAELEKLLARAPECRDMAPQIKKSIASWRISR